jgi:hypothetical protein
LLFATQDLVEAMHAAVSPRMLVIGDALAWEDRRAGATLDD